MKEGCLVCSGQTEFIGSHLGVLDNTEYLLEKCLTCQFTHVVNHRTDYSNIYDENYYRGVGADRSVDYVYELENSDNTVRNYEWEGIFAIFKELCPQGGRWLDFGCGGGGGVRFAIQNGVDAVGYEEGWIADMGRSMGIPILNSTELDNYKGTFDFICAIEVLEHVSDPVEVLKQIRQLLKPGGVLFLTTGNAYPWRDNLLSWAYTQCPEVHISFYEPSTLERCLDLAGFSAKNFSSANMFIEIIKFKILKSLKIKRTNVFLDLLPWQLITKVVNARHQVSKQPYGVAVDFE